MTNAVYTLIVRALSGLVSDRAADTMLRASLRESGLGPETVTAAQMQQVLRGPLLARLSGLLPPERARAELQALAAEVQARHPRAPTLFLPPAAAWDENSPEQAWTAPTWEDPVDTTLSADDFEFDDPEYAAPVGARSYALDTPEGQEALIQDLGRLQGVQGVLVCRASGEVLRERALRGGGGLGGVVAATAMLFQSRSLRLMSADMGDRTVCMRPLGGYCVAVVAGAGVNVGRLLAELGQIRTGDAA
ncbi:roadblock/LC7 domain-containing protein [Deinococcus sp. MIMF12]|uniref:Roadblock/LC7 domain-containing protein n=1 Tax=Deinococcus rhizophilus TaxID=3049544 RepID=A0ABT7JHW2_9DEIO|nr:roadblock/LC7 domain-containing protein [Deinococcus rhizophilus]MDL2343538.1 roadblock/LC7 domain-containing protein [Deinococcus rhizophilus]